VEQPRRSRGRGPWVEQLEWRLAPAAFTPGNLAILRANENDTNSPVSIVEISPTTAGQTNDAVQRIDVPGTGSSAIRVSGSDNSTGYMARTNDGSLLAFTGANSTNTTSNVNTLNPRAVATLNDAGTFAIATTYTGVSGNQTRGATSIDNSAWFISDQGG